MLGDHELAKVGRQEYRRLSGWSPEQVPAVFITAQDPVLDVCLADAGVASASEHAWFGQPHAVSNPGGCSNMISGYDERGEASMARRPGLRGRTIHGPIGPGAEPSD